MNLETRVRSTAMRALSSARFQRLQRGRAQLLDRLGRRPAVVHYFHQVDDPYSHLAVQKLNALQGAYTLPFQVHLVAKPEAAFQGSSAHFDTWARTDAASVADAYRVDFPTSPCEPDDDAIAAANEFLASHLQRGAKESDFAEVARQFAEVARQVGDALWTGGLPPGPSDAGRAQQTLAEGNALRTKLGHYLGGMFYYQGEWYWGVDRLRLLEERLATEGLRRPDTELCVPEPVPADSSGADARHILLEYFPSLRSPYTAVGHQRVLDLIERSGVSVKLRPVMPMMMRGIPAPRAKQRYIITDAGREARAHGVPFGRGVDPFGEPVKRAFALFPGADALGKGMAFISAYLTAAWAEGLDITSEAGLRKVVSNAGLEWDELQDACQGTDWEAMLAENLNEMLAAGLWGVPSFRVSGGSRESAFSCWGQDRIWRVENDIARRA